MSEKIMKATKSDKRMQQNLNKLIDMGFDVSQVISGVLIGGVKFDLSAIEINEDNVFSYILNKTFNAGQAEGQRILKQKFNELLN